jgi:hypothetical protein
MKSNYNNAVWRDPDCGRAPTAIRVRLARFAAQEGASLSRLQNGGRETLSACGTTPLKPNKA